MIVSFKLETDIDMLAGKAAAALRRYGVHLVVANQLETRKDTVYLVTASMSSRRADARQREQQKSLGMTSEDRESAAQDAVQVLKNIPSDVQVTRLDRPPHIEVIEQLLVDRIVSSHRQYMNGAAAEDACQP
jgi:phosphopantothenate---cysteine ligase (ATP)